MWATHEEIIIGPVCTRCVVVSNFYKNNNYIFASVGPKHDVCDVHDVKQEQRINRYLFKKSIFHDWITFAL